MTDEIKINIPALTRVEGEGALALTIRDNRIEALELKIYEPPRLFEKTLEGRFWHEVPDMVARICGICPVAYQMSAVQALESIFGFEPTPWIRAMRRLYYCGEWIESHALHMHLLALPDFLGFDNVIDMSAQYTEEVRRGLSLQHLGNEIIALLGGRSVNPVGARVGGFHHQPDAAQRVVLLEKIEQAIPEAQALVRWVASLDLPQQQQEFVFAALRNGEEYPMNYGDIHVSTGDVIPISEFENRFHEKQQDYSTALHCLFDERDYLVGPLARLNLNHDLLPDSVRELLAEVGLRFPSQNMFESLAARAVEILVALIEARRLLTGYSAEQPGYEIKTRAGTGYGCTEAPRGFLWHRYDCDDIGVITHSRIVPPTSQNQARIEADLRFGLQAYGLEHPEKELRLLSEQIIRNYDPCISCATHFLKMEIRHQ